MLDQENNYSEEEEDDERNYVRDVDTFVKDQERFLK